MRRRDLLHAVAALPLALPAQALGQPAPPPSSPPPPGKAPPAQPGLTRVIARVGKNHGHVFTVPFADVVAAAARTYDLTGTASHPHAVTLTSDHMITLATGAIVRVRSTESNNHGHRLWVRCAPPTDPPEWISACKATFTGKDEHELIIPAVHLSSTSDRTYDVQGIAGHAHQLTLTASDFETLRKGFPVSRHTSRLEGDAHMHGVTVERLRTKP
jgi:hypothetical protein